MSSREPSDSPEPSRSDGTSFTLLDRIRSNDEEAWRRTIFLYSPLVRYWCLQKNIRPDDVEDVAQEVFRAVVAGIERFRRDRPGDTFRGWLRGVTQNKALAWHRDRRHQPAAEGGTEAHEKIGNVEAEPDDQPDEPGQVAGLYRRALDLVKNEFEARTWTAFWRVAVDHHETADVARDLGLSPASVRQAKSRVLRRLREEMGELID
jgi:RNA polymerase sigma-70 factor (ECF subfamily)